MKKSIFTLLFLASLSPAIAQLAHQEEISKRPLEIILYEKEVLRKVELQKILKERNLNARTTYSDGSIKEAMYVSPTGQIIYNTTYNIGAGRTLSTNKVWPGGTIGTSLTGANMTNRLGIWDGGAVRTTHQELTGRVTQTDGATQLSDHATHVAGTMIASGIDANAKGMAYAASLKAYDWSNDNSEMMQAAAAGMLLSNHSYGNVCGWSYDQAQARWEWFGDRFISTVEDYKFGLYNDDAEAWDDIAFTYPNYLICKAAGNDRGDNLSGATTWYHADGTLGSGTAPLKDGGVLGYDCVSTYATSKNILTVGAVNKIGGNTGNGWTKSSDVVMSSFSGWGPTDDGRIKPDVVSPGVSIYSTYSSSNTAYSTIQGTSMATPAVTGSLLLVQQHYFARKNKYMRAASLKGLVIHTADEAGTSEGPDYRFGWGLMNTASAVKFINDSGINKLEERTLTSGSQQNLQFSADAGKPLKVTISWTDRPGTPVTSNLLDNTTKMLVNDLDIRLTRQSDNTIFSPFVLDPANPANAATTGDNSLDNIEVISIAAPTTGNYTLTISHKGTLVGGSQAFSILISNGVEKPLAQFTSTNNIICVGQTVTFTDGSTGAVSQRNWSFPGGTPSTSTLTNPVITYNTPGIYPVLLKIVGGLGTDSVYKTDYITVGGKSLPFIETFESNSPTINSWTNQNPDAATTWALYSTSGLSPGNTSVGINFYDYSTTGQRDALIAPALNLSTHTNVNLTFKHAYTRYGGSNQTDSLIVYASTNCGATWTRLQGFGENGTGNFATYQEASYPFGSQTSFSPSAASNWCGGGTGSGCKTISLAQFAGQSSVTLKFESYNRYGNNLYIDNISVDGTLLKPVASFQSRNMVCTDEPVAFTDKSTNFPTAWEWDFTGANINASSQRNPIVTYSTPGVYNVKLKASNASGSDSITQSNYITVVAKPTKPNIRATGVTEFCLGDSILLSTDSSGTIRWYANEVLIAQNTQQVYAKQNGTYRVANFNGTCEISSSINVSVDAKPSTPIVTSNITGLAFCTGGSATLTSSANNGNQWYKNGNVIGGANAKTYGATDSGSYSVITTTGGCSSNESLAKTYSLLARPTVGNITGTNAPVRGEANNYNVTAESGLTYIWSIAGGKGNILSGNNTASISARFNVVDTATLLVISRNSASCQSIASSMVVNVTPAVGLNENLAIRNLSIYPIPAKTVINLKLEGLENSHADVRIINMLGQVVQTQNINLSKGINMHTINVHDLNKGVYLIEIQHSKNRLVKRIVLE
jgi:PKD repeat protein